MDEREVLRRAAELAAEWFESRRRSGRSRRRASIAELRDALGGPLPETGAPDLEVIEELARDGEPGLTAMGSGRYFGFVIGGTLPAALAADWLVSAWDQNAGLLLPTPTAAVVEEIAGHVAQGAPRAPGRRVVRLRDRAARWRTSTALAAARDAVLHRAGWTVGERASRAARRLRIVAGEKRHVTVDRALRLLGIGSEPGARSSRSDDQGRMRAELLAAALAESDGPTIVCAQAGEVNTGAFDDFDAIADACEGAGAGCTSTARSGCGRRASPRSGISSPASSEPTPGRRTAHKWLNVPYDCGIAFCAAPGRAPARDERDRRVPASRSTTPRGASRWPTRPSSRAAPARCPCTRRSARSAATASRELVERCCDHARRIRRAASRGSRAARC